MPPVSAAVLDVPLLRESVPSSAPPGGEAPATTAPAGAITPRFRIAVRKAAPREEPRRAPAAVNRVFAYAGLPALLLVVYILSWTMAMRGGYLRDQLRAELKEARVQHSELLTRLNEQLAPARVLPPARAMGLRPAPPQRVDVPASAVWGEGERGR